MNTVTTRLQKKYTALSIEHPLEHVALRALFFAVGACLCMYLYFVSASVLNVIAQREATQASQVLEGKIGELEQHYFALTGDVTSQNATDIGLVPISETAYMYRPGAVGVVAVSSNAI